MYHNGIQGIVDRCRLTGVNGSASVLELKVFTAKGNLVQFNLPVGLSAHGGVRELALVGGSVDTTKSSLSSVFLRGSHAESEHRFVEETLVHKVVEWRDDVVDGDGVVSKTEDTVESRYRGLKGGGQGAEGVTYLPKAKARPGSFVASAKSMPFTVRSPIVKTSFETKPSMEPEP